MRAVDEKPQLKLVIWKIRLELSGEASAAGRDQAKDNVFRTGCKFYCPETTEPPQELEGFKKCIRFLYGVTYTLEEGSEKSWRVLSFRNLFWFLKLRKQSLNNVVMSTSGTRRITYCNRGMQVTGTDKQELQIPWKPG